MKLIKVSIVPVAVVALALAWSLGFSGGGASPVDAEDTLGAVPEVVLTEEEADSVQAALVEEAPPAQAAVMADGTVTVAEYTAAVNRSKDCVTDAMNAAADAHDVDITVEPSASEMTEDQYQIDYTFQVRIAKEDIAEVVANPDLDVSAYEPQCQAEDLEQVEQFYQAELRSSEDYIEESVQDPADCVGDGVAADQVSAEDAVEVVASASSEARTDPAAQACLAQSPSLTQVIEPDAN
jgi:hypothetical protein